MCVCVCYVTPELLPNAFSLWCHVGYVHPYRSGRVGGDKSPHYTEALCLCHPGGLLARKGRRAANLQKDGGKEKGDKREIPARPSGFAQAHHDLPSIGIYL